MFPSNVKKETRPPKVSLLALWINLAQTILYMMYEMVWASLIHNAGKGTFGGLVSFLPLEGNIIAAQDQQIIYAYLKWRGKQCGVGSYVYHAQNFSPPNLPKLRVEDNLHELPI